LNFPSVTQGVKFDNPNYPYPYSADFILVHSSGLSIDIEIDEPYVGHTKEPHHCIDQGKDEIRNEFFISNNWVVIRFSEKQVVKYPYRCCKVIAQAIAQVTGDYTFISRLQNTPDLPVEPMWNIKQAQKLAKLDYRKTYLQLK
jgi:very-short-patch-repair endonuclease